MQFPEQKCHRTKRSRCMWESDNETYRVDRDKSVPLEYDGEDDLKSPYGIRVARQMRRVLSWFIHGYLRNKD